MKRCFLFLIMVIYIAICCSCQRKSDNPFLQINPGDIESIIIRSQLTDKYPQQVTIITREKIQKIMNQLIMVEYDSSIDDTDENGWIFHIIIEMESSKDINVTLLSDIIKVGENKYKTSENLVDKLEELVDNLEAQKQK